MSKRKSKEEYINEAILKHGIDKYSFDRCFKGLFKFN